MAEETGMPLMRGDKDPQMRALFEKMKARDKETGGPPSLFTAKSDPESRRVIQEVVVRMLKTQTPHIMEGTQFAQVPQEMLAGHRKVYVDRTPNQVVRQRLRRDRGKKKMETRNMTPGSPLARERADLSRRLIADMASGMAQFREGADLRVPDKPKQAADVTLNQAIARAARKAVKPTEAQAEAGVPGRDSGADDSADLAVENIRHILITGMPAAGKTTRGTALAAERGMPLISLDGWKGDPTGRGNVDPRAALKELDTPSVVEGAQLLSLTPEERAQHEVEHLTQPRNEIIKRLMHRGWEDSAGDFHKGRRDRAAAGELHDIFKGIEQKNQWPKQAAEFKTWLKDGSQTRPVATQTGQMKVAGVEDIFEAVTQSESVRKWLKSQGMEPGPFQPSGNINDYREKIRFGEMKEELVRIAASSDPAPRKILRGIAQAFGIEWSPDMESQADVLQEGYATAAPHLMRWAPGWWDELHGSTGSQASLVSAIADAHRYQNMEPEQALTIAEQMMGDFYDDPLKHRGFAANELGDIYREASRRGHIAPGMDAEQIVGELTPIVGAVSAVRDASTEAGGDPDNVPAMFSSLDRMMPQYGSHPWQEIESQIRMGRYLGQQNGLMTAATQMAGLSAGPGGSGTASLPITGTAGTAASGRAGQDRLEAQNAQLMQQAAASPVMNLVAATARAANEGFIEPDSRAGKWLAAAKTGDITYTGPMQWAQMMGQSSSTLSPRDALTFLHQPMTNRRAITPEMIAGVRMGQSQIDHQPRIDMMNRAFPGKRPKQQSLRQGALDTLATRWGYTGWDNYQQQHGPAAKNIGKVIGNARGFAQDQSNMAGTGWAGPTERVIDTFKGPEPATATSLMAGFAGGIPKTADHPQTVAVDLDGTLAKMYAKFDPKTIEDPRPGAKAAMEEFKRRGCQIIVNTVRGDEAMVKKWLKKHEIPYDHINENPNQPDDASDKVIADLYIDDRGVDARPAWRKVMEKVLPRLARKKKAAAEDPLKQLLERATLMGSRGRARKYGRPEPDRDYDQIVFTDDAEEQASAKQWLEQLIAQGYERHDRPDGFLTASGDNQDISVYPTARKPIIEQSWALQEDGMPKDDAWAQIEKQALTGIPDREDFGDASQLKAKEIIDLVIQRHKAQRAGEHFDYRIGTPDTGLLSWSMKPTRMPKPGEKRFVRQQPVHSHQYGSFQGTLGKGYGKGTVRREQKGKLLITAAAPDKIEFTVASSGTPERFVLLKPKSWEDRGWLLINNTPHKPTPYEKTHYKKIPAEEVEPYIQQMQEGTSVQAKLDGASSLVKLLRNGAEIMSYRVSKKTGRPIVHTERVFGCFAGDSRVELENGDLRRIDCIQAGDRVATPTGPARVLARWDNGDSNDWLEVSAGARRFAVTPNHRFYVAGVGWVPIVALMGQYAEVMEDGQIQVDDTVVQELQAGVYGYGEAPECQAMLATMRRALGGKGAQNEDVVCEGAETDRATQSGMVAGTATAADTGVKRLRVAPRTVCVSAAVCRGNRNRAADMLSVSCVSRAAPPQFDRPAAAPAARQTSSELERRCSQRRGQMVTRYRHIGGSGTLRNVQRSKQSCVAPHMAAETQRRAQPSKSCAVLPPLPCGAGPDLPEAGRRIICIRRLPRTRQRRYDLYIDCDEQWYKVEGFVVHNSRPKFEVPKGLVGTVLKGELYGQRQADQNPSAHPGRAAKAVGRTPGVVDGPAGAGAAQATTGGAGGGELPGDRADSAEVREGDVAAGRHISPDNATGAGGARGQVVPPQELGGLLNATIEHSLAKQKETGVSIKNMLYDIQQRGKEQIDPAVTPYAERRKMIQEIMQHLPQDTFGLSEEATTPETAQKLWQSILDKQHPLTHEGVVIHPPTGKPIKAKPMEESDVHITDVFPGAGRLQGTSAGGFGYSLEPGGDRVGEVGTGLTDELRRQLWTDRDDYVGRTARIRSQEQHPSGAWRAPSLIAMHEDYPLK